jgi:hypothetical protein
MPFTSAIGGIVGYGRLPISAVGGFLTNWILSSLPTGWSNIRPTRATFTTLMNISGDAGAGTAATGVQNTNNYTVATELIVSWRGNLTNNCPDYGITITSSGVNGYWNWSTNANIIRFQNNCSTTQIYLPTSTVTGPTRTWTQNQWYTARCSYNPTTGFCRHRGYIGQNVTTGTPNFDISGTSATRFTPYWWAINADNDGGVTSFDNLTIRAWDGSS